MIFINNHISLNDNEVEISAMRAQGAGGQNVNKVSSAIHLRFDICASSLSDEYKQRLLDSMRFFLTLFLINRIAILSTLPLNGLLVRSKNRRHRGIISPNN